MTRAPLATEYEVIEPADLVCSVCEQPFHVAAARLARSRAALQQTGWYDSVSKFWLLETCPGCVALDDATRPAPAASRP
jgi:hypothetical protein